MKLQRLQPRLATANTARLQVLEAKAGSTPRMRGDAWMKVRKQVLLDGGFACVDCGHVSFHNEIDHEVPLEQGGSNDHGNLKIRCGPCHKAKSATETRTRFGKD